jgi:hypothetical protein
VSARRLEQKQQYLTVGEILFRAAAQMARYHASAAILTGLAIATLGFALELAEQKIIPLRE